MDTATTELKACADATATEQFYAMDRESLDMWIRYQTTKSTELRNQLVMKYLVIVKKIAYKIYRNYRFCDSTEELVGEGIVALISSIDKFDLSRNVKFETYASRRIQGSMMDYINKQNGYVRKIHEIAKAIATAREDLAVQIGYEPSNEELATYLQITVDQLKKQIQNIQPISVVSLDQMTWDFESDDHRIDVSSGEKDDPMVIVADSEYSDVLINCIKKLTKEQQLILSLFYKDELTIREIAEVANMTTQHASQVRFQAVKKLKKLLGDNIIDI